MGRQISLIPFTYQLLKFVKKKKKNPHLLYLLISHQFNAEWMPHEWMLHDFDHFLQIHVGRYMVYGVWSMGPSNSVSIFLFYSLYFYTAPHDTEHGTKTKCSGSMAKLSKRWNENNHNSKRLKMNSWMRKWVKLKTTTFVSPSFWFVNSIYFFFFFAFFDHFFQIINETREYAMILLLLYCYFL